MIIFIHGADAFRAKEKLNELKRRFLEKNNGNLFLISEIDGDDFNIADFRNKVLSAGFFAEKKMIIVKYNLQFTIYNLQLLEIIKKITEETALIIWNKETDEKFLKSDLGKFLTGQKYVFEFNFLSGNELIKWIRDRAKNYGCEIDNEAIAEVCDILGNDLWKIDLELSKLCAYAAPHAITKKTVGEMLSKDAEDNIFGFIDALAAKNKKSALFLLEEEFNAGISELAVLGAVAAQVRNLIQTKFFSEGRTISKDELAKKIGAHPYVAQKSLTQAKNFQLNELKNIYRQLLAVDMAVKSGGASAKALFGRIVAKI